MLAFADTAVGTGPTASTQAWFAGGERVGYDPKARSIVAAQDAPFKIFLRREGDVAHAVSFLPGFPDGSFGWAKVQPHLPNAVLADSGPALAPLCGQLCGRFGEFRAVIPNPVINAAAMSLGWNQ